MSAKRKLDEVGAGDDKKQLSAFAAAQAYRNALEDSLSDSDSLEDAEQYAHALPNTGDVNDDEQQVDQDSDRETDYEADGLGSRPVAEDLTLSTWRPCATNYKVNDNVTRISMEPKETVTFVGQYDLRVVSGIITVYGGTFKADKTIYRVFAPSTHALPTICCWAGGSEIELRPCHHTMRPLEKVSPLFSRIWNCRQRTPLPPDRINPRGASYAYVEKTSDDPLKRPLTPLTIHPSWGSALVKIMNSVQEAPPKVLVCGIKGSGKSTLCRVLANCFITAQTASSLRGTPNPNASSTACLLDLDPGQPEFSAQGQISLVHLRKPVFGPPYTHPCTHKSSGARLIRAHNIAALSPQEDPEYYMNCFKDLLSHYHHLQREYLSCPLIINCSGWIFGAALEVTMQIIQQSNVSDVVYLSQLTKEPNIIEIGLRKAAENIPFHHVGSNTSQPDRRTPADLRTMQSISYFHQQYPVHGELRWSALDQFSQKSKTVRFDLQTSDILGVLSLGEQPQPEFLFTILEGAYVAIVVLEDDEETKRIQSTVERTSFGGIPCIADANGGLVRAPSPSKSRTIGLALIKSINIEGQSLCLQTPISPLEIDAVFVKTEQNLPRVVLVRGSLDIPGWAYTEHLHINRALRSKAQHRSQGGTDAQASADVEDLSIDKTSLPERYDVSNSEDEEDDHSTMPIPWVTKIGQGERIARVWGKKNRNFRKTM